MTTQPITVYVIVCENTETKTSQPVEVCASKDAAIYACSMAAIYNTMRNGPRKYDYYEVECHEWRPHHA